MKIKVGFRFQIQRKTVGTLSTQNVFKVYYNERINMLLVPNKLFLFNKHPPKSCQK